MWEEQDDLVGYATFIVFFPNSGVNARVYKKRPTYEYAFHTDRSIQ